MGYNTQETFNGNQAKGVMFLPISGEGKLCDLTVTGYDREEGYDGGQISCGKLDTYGRSIARYYWFDTPEFEDEGEIFPACYGWYDDECSECFNEVPLSAGEGLWMKFPAGAFTVQSAGQVAQGTVMVNLINGNQLCSNPMPTIVEIGDAFITGYDPEEGYDGGQISCGKLDTYGRSIARYYWFDTPEFEDEGEVFPACYGWYNDDCTECFNDVELNPGEAVWLKSNNATYKLNWKSPLK